MSNSRVSNAANFHGQNANTVRVEPTRNFNGNLRNNFRGESTRPLCFEMNTDDWNEASAEAFTEHMNTERLTSKELARKIGCSHRTVENYISGRTSPAGLHFLRSLAVIPQFEARVRQVVGMISTMDPRAEHAALSLVQAAMKFLDARAERQEQTEAQSSSPRDVAEGVAGEERDLLTGDLFEAAGRA